MLYVADGMLRELFSRKGLPVNADMAAEIARADKLEARFIGEQQLVLTLSSNGESPVSASQWSYLRVASEVKP